MVDCPLTVFNDDEVSPFQPPPRPLGEIEAMGFPLSSPEKNTVEARAVRPHRKDWPIWATPAILAQFFNALRHSAFFVLGRAATGVLQDAADFIA